MKDILDKFLLTHTMKDLLLDDDVMNAIKEAIILFDKGEVMQGGIKLRNEIDYYLQTWIDEGEPNWRLASDINTAVAMLGEKDRRIAELEAEKEDSATDMLNYLSVIESRERRIAELGKIAEDYRKLIQEMVTEHPDIFTDTTEEHDGESK